MTAVENCLFCKIVAGAIPATIVFENEHAVAFEDIAPQAPTHVLVIPKHHVASLHEATDPVTMGHLLAAVQATVKQLGLTDYRVVTNTGAGAGQSVFHWHWHILAGRPLAWPPG